MTQELDFPAQAVNCLFWCMYAVVGLRTVLEWDESLVRLINLVCLGATQTKLEGWLSSPQPRSSTGRGGSGPEGLCNKEGTDFLVLGACGCPRSQVSSGVGVLSFSMSSPA